MTEKLYVRSCCAARLLVLLGLIAGCAGTTRADDRVAVLGALPESPGQVAQGAQAGVASVAGVVLDVKGEPVPGAQVTVTSLNGKAPAQVMSSDDKGEFRFPSVPVATITVSVTARGLETFISNEIRLVAGEHYQLPRIDLPLAPLNSDVTVTVTEDQLATEQVHEQEKQRILGVIPNFYTSFVWDAAPMRGKQKLHLMYKATTDPVVFALVGVRAGVEQARGTDPGYGDGFAGFARRYGAAYGDSVTGRILGQALLPALFHQDPRYFYKGSGTVKGRFWYAVTRSVVTRGDNGEDQPNYSHVAGNFGAAALRNLYLDPSDRKGWRTVLNGFTITGFNAASNVIREFLFRRLSTNVPEYKNGKPVDAR